jgi:hypothetical protein
MFSRVLESGRIFGKQYLYVVADLKTLKQPEYDANRCVNFPDDFLQGLKQHNIKDQNSAAVWGGASKGVIFTLLKSRHNQMINVIIDINPAKQGKYLPASGLRVNSPEMALQMLPHGSTVFVMNSNYLKEIKQMFKSYFNYVTIEA